MALALTRGTDAANPVVAGLVGSAATAARLDGKRVGSPRSRLAIPHYGPLDLVGGAGAQVGNRASIRVGWWAVHAGAPVVGTAGADL